MIISNSSCLIILDKLDRLTVLKELYGTVTIPKAVQEEVFSEKETPNWIKVVEIRQPAAPRLLEKNLGAGEREAIALFLESTADLLILDNLASRQVARKLGIPFTGVVGVLLAAKREGLIDTVKDTLDEMIRQDFRLSKTVYESALNLAGEPAEHKIMEG